VFKKIMFGSILITALLGFVVFAMGFAGAIMVTTNIGSQASPASALNAQTSDTTAQVSSRNTNSIKILILGDSIAKGTGDEKGKGFSVYLPEDFKTSTSKEIIVDNAGIDGQESRGLLELLQSGRFDNKIADMNMVVVSIGGNDVRQILTMNSIAKEGQFNTIQVNYIRNLKAIIQVIRNINPTATIICLGLYNPYEKSGTSADTRLLNEWNYNTQQLIGEDGKAIFIPTYDLMHFNLNQYIARDGMHPDSAGYEVISERISRTVATIVKEL